MDMEHKVKEVSVIRVDMEHKVKEALEGKVKEALEIMVGMEGKIKEVSEVMESLEIRVGMMAKVKEALDLMETMQDKGVLDVEINCQKVGDLIMDLMDFQIFQYIEMLRNTLLALVAQKEGMERVEEE